MTIQSKHLEERLAKATGPDRELDGLLSRLNGQTFGFCGDEGWSCGKAGCTGCGEALGLHDERHSYPRDWRDDERLARYTSSIDAALALVERVLPGVWWIMSKGRLTHDEPLFACQLLFGADESLAIADGPTAPLAILSALIRSIGDTNEQT